MIYELLVQFFENGAPTSKPEVVQVCPALRIKSIVERGYGADDDTWFFIDVDELHRGGKCVPARFNDVGKKYGADILCGAYAGEAYASSKQFQRTGLRYNPNENYPPSRGRGSYANLICRPVTDALTS